MNVFPLRFFENFRRDNMEHGTLEFAVETIIGIFVTFLSWSVSTIKAMLERRATDLEAKHAENSRRIDEASEKIICIKERVAILETTTIKKEDLDDCLNDLRELLERNIKDSFKHVHDRVDVLYKGGSKG